MAQGATRPTRKRTTGQHPQPRPAAEPTEDNVVEMPVKAEFFKLPAGLAADILNFFSQQPWAVANPYIAAIMQLEKIES